MEKYTSVIQFSESAPKLTVAFQDYFNHIQSTERGVKGLAFSEKSLNDKEKVINKLFADELQKRTGMEVPTDDIDKAKRFSTNPIVLYFADEIVDNLIDMILPDSLISSIGMIADIRFGGLLDSFSFDIENNALFSVSKAGHRQRNVPAQVLEDTTVTLAPTNREVTVKVTLPEILTGRKSIAKYLMKVMRSIEAELTYDAYDTLATTMDTLAAPLMYGSYTEPNLITACQTVTAWNQGRKAIILGTPLALKSILPSSANTRILLDDGYVKYGSLSTFNGYDVIAMNQVADHNSDNYGLKLKDNRIYIISPASDKLIKVAVGGDTLSHTSGAYDKANLSMFGTVNKAWAVGCITNSIGAEIKLA